MENREEWCIMDSKGLYLQNVLDGTSNNFVTYTQDFNNRMRFYSLSDAQLQNASDLVQEKIVKVTISFEEVI